MLFGAGEALTGLRMIGTGISWLLKSRQAPWSAVDLTATIQPHILPWYDVRFWCLNERPTAIELLSARTIRPKRLLLCRATPTSSPVMVPKSEANIVEGLGWIISERGQQPTRFEKHLFVKVEELSGDITIDFEIKARFLNNRRAEIPVWVRTNTIRL
jgi:hypothetical protein